MKILYLGFYHRPNDPRLFHREMQALWSAAPQIEIYFFSYGMLQKLDSQPLAVKSYARSASKPPAQKKNSLFARLREKLPFGILQKALDAAGGTVYSLRKFALWLAYWYRQLIALRALRPQVIQASDARELGLGVLLSGLTGARLIYDAHEDYFNAVYEYQGKTRRAFWQAKWLVARERLFLNFVRAVFCTDDYLYEHYTRLVGRRKPVSLLRNFPYAGGGFPRVAAYQEKQRLDLVYVGGVNPHRGIIECADYVAEFNRRFQGGKSLTFTVYSHPHEITTTLASQGLLRHIPNMDYRSLLAELVNYDVGVGLLLPIVKYERNLPIKNFDYMAVGLPVLTSNFGNLEKYARESGAAVCIDPRSYDEFEQAVLRLFDPQERRRLGEQGIRYTRSAASFAREAEPYIQTILQRGGQA